MKGRVTFFFVFSFLCIIALTACGSNSELSTGDNNVEIPVVDDGGTSSTTDEDTNQIDNDSIVFDYEIIEVNSVGKKFDSIYSEFEDENDLVLDDSFEPNADYNTIDACLESIESMYSIYNEIDSIMSNSDYKISISLDSRKGNNSIIANYGKMKYVSMLDDSNEDDRIDNYYFDNVYYGDDEIPFYLEDGNLIMYWNQKNTFNEDFTFVFHDNNGKNFVEKKNFNFAIKEKDFSLHNPIIKLRDNTLRISFPANDYSYGILDNYSVLLFKNGIFIDSCNFYYYNYEEPCVAYFFDIYSNHNYEYVIVENRDDKISVVNWGEIKSNIPYSIVYNDITNSSINVSISNKGTRNITEYVELYDSKKLVEKKNLNNNYIFKNLKSGKEYTLKIYYSYFEGFEKKTGYCIKNIRTLKNNEELVGIKFDRVVINPETDDYFYKEYNWTNGTKIIVSDFKAQPEEEKYTITDTGYVRFVLPYDAIISMKLSDANRAGQYLKSVLITDDSNNTISVPLKSNENYYTQSFYFKAGDYKLSSGGGNINIRNFIIREVIKDNKCREIIKNVSLESDEFLFDEKAVYQVGKKFTTYNFRENHYYDNYYLITKTGEFKYYISKEDGSYLSEIKENDIIDSKYFGDCKLVVKDKDGSIVISYDIYVYESDLNVELELYDDITKLNDVSRLVTDTFNTDKYKIKVTINDIEHPYSEFIYLKDNNPGISLSYDIDGVSYNNIECIDSDYTSNGLFRFVYDTDYLGLGTLEIPFTFRTLKLFGDEPTENSITITAKKTEFVDKVDSIDRYISMSLLDNNNIEFNLDYYNLIKVFPDTLKINYETYEQKDEYDSYYVFITYNDIVVSNKILIKEYHGASISYYGGYNSINANWIVCSSNRTQCAVNEGECCVGGEGIVTKLVYAFGKNGDYLETTDFHATNKISLVILSGTKTTVKEVYFTVSILDDNGNVVDSKVVLGSYDKNAYRNVIDFDFDVDIYKVRIDNVTTDAASGTIGILSIELAYI